MFIFYQKELFLSYQKQVTNYKRQKYKKLSRICRIQSFQRRKAPNMYQLIYKYGATRQALNQKEKMLKQLQLPLHNFHCHFNRNKDFLNRIYMSCMYHRVHINKFLPDSYIKWNQLEGTELLLNQCKIRNFFLKTSPHACNSQNTSVFRL